MPSPTSSTSPTSRDSSCWPYWLISCWRTRTISSASKRMAASREKLVLERLDAGADGGVDHMVADLKAAAAQTGRVHGLDQNRVHVVEPLPGQGLHLVPLAVGQWYGGGHLHPQPSGPLVHQLPVHD